MNLNNLQSIVGLCCACTIWGLSGIYYHQLSHIAPLEVLAHRSIWAMIFFSGILLYQGRLSNLMSSLLRPRELGLMVVSALLISVNWFSFILAIQTEQAVQASFGYYIFPLVAVLFGYVFKGERFSKIQVLAILFAGVSVLSLGFALSLTPLIALIIGLTFGAYGLIKSFVALGSIESVTIETMLIAPFSLVFIIFNYISKGQADYQLANFDLLLLMLSGLLTGGPLILFSFATKKLNYATVGILQYINPTLQFLVAIFVFTEPFNIWHAAALVFIWIGIIVYSSETARLESTR